MQEFINYFEQVAHELPEYVWWLHLVAVAVIIGITQGLKLPIKKFGTDKLAELIAKKKGKEDTTSLTAIRHKINIVFIFLPFGIGILVSYIISVIAEQYPFSWEVGLMWGSVSGTIYETIARIIRRINAGAPITAETVKTDFVSSEKETQKAKKEFLALVENAKKTKSK